MILKTLKFSALFLITCGLISCGSNTGSEGKTPSGYSYTKLHDTKGANPKKGEYVYFEMDIKDDKGTVLQSMRDLEQMPAVQIPLEKKVGEKPNPIIELLAMSAVGDTLELIIPSDSLPGIKSQYGELEHIAYFMEIKEFTDQETYTQRMTSFQEKKRAEMDADRMTPSESSEKEQEIAAFVKGTLAAYKSGKLDNIEKLDSGLEIVMHEEGDGATVPNGKQIKAHYYGVVKESGDMFDNSFSKGTPFSFTLGRGQVIKGWDEGMAKIKQGGKATLFIPYEMAYGEMGRPPRIPAKSDLVFYVEVL